MGTAGEFEGNTEAEKWFYSVSYEEDITYKKAVDMQRSGLISETEVAHLMYQHKLENNGRLEE